MASAEGVVIFYVIQDRYESAKSPKPVLREEMLSCRELVPLKLSDTKGSSRRLTPQ